MIDFNAIEKNFSPTKDHKFAHAKGGMVASAFPGASKAGALMLKKGGNAIDASIACALALGVCEPQASGLGGQSMALIHFKGITFALDGSGPIPKLAGPEKFGPDEHKIGYKATSVPTTPAVLGYMHKNYGTLKWEEIVEPAIKIANNGYAITQLQHDLQKRELKNFFVPRNPSGAEYFLKNGKTPYQVGDVFKQPDLAKLLIHLAENKAQSFYTGKIAKIIDEDMRENNGFLRASDLADIPWPKLREPIKGSFKGLEIVSCPPPTAGRVLLHILGLLDQAPNHLMENWSLESVYFFINVMHYALMEKEKNQIWPDQYDPLKDKFIGDENFLKATAQKILQSQKAFSNSSVKPPLGGETTHLSVMDNMGNTVGITQSVNLVYASKTACQGLGFLYNDYLCDTSPYDPLSPYYRKHGHMPWSSVGQSIVMREKQPWIVLGSPGSERILSAIAQFLSHMLNKSQSMDKAITEKRIHCSSDKVVSLEPDGFKPEIIKHLENSGFELDYRKNKSFFLGAVHAVMKCRSQNGFQGVAEVRRDGACFGPDDV